LTTLIGRPSFGLCSKHKLASQRVHPFCAVQNINNLFLYIYFLVGTSLYNCSSRWLNTCKWSSQTYIQWQRKSICWNTSSWFWPPSFCGRIYYHFLSYVYHFWSCHR